MRPVYGIVVASSGCQQLVATDPKTGEAVLLGHFSSKDLAFRLVNLLNLYGEVDEPVPDTIDGLA